MNIMTVNQAIDGLDLFHDKYIYVEGVFHLQFENVSINHWPESESRYDYKSSLWANISWKAVSYNEKVLSSWNGERVVVCGRLRKPITSTGQAQYL